jgi:hypothetical protein
MRTRFDRVETGAAALGLAASAAAAVLSARHAALSVADVFRYAGVMMLLQSLFRDVYLLATRRADAGAQARRGWFICAESALGAALIAQGLFLFALGVENLVTLHVAAWGALASLWVLTGYAIRSLVFEAKLDPDHLNLLIGRPFQRPAAASQEAAPAEEPQSATVS